MWQRQVSEWLPTLLQQLSFSYRGKTASMAAAGFLTLELIARPTRAAAAYAPTHILCAGTTLATAKALLGNSMYDKLRSIVLAQSRGSTS